MKGKLDIGGDNASIMDKILENGRSALLVCDEGV